MAQSPGDGVSSQHSERRFPRYDVELKVRFLDAQEYVEQYAHSLSEGGLFVADVDVEPMTEVSVELELPGFGSHQVKTRVAYVLGVEEAIKHGRQPGAGLAIVESPEGFDRSLKRYLMILGRRADSQVLVTDGGFGRLLRAAGYQTSQALAAAEIAEQLRGSPRVVGLVVVGEAAAYRNALEAADLPGEMVIEAGRGSSAHDLLNLLDSRLTG